MTQIHLMRQLWKNHLKTSFPHQSKVKSVFQCKFRFKSWSNFVKSSFKKCHHDFHINHNGLLDSILYPPVPEGAPHCYVIGIQPDTSPLWTPALSIIQYPSTSSSFPSPLVTCFSFLLFYWHKRIRACDGRVKKNLSLSWCWNVLTVCLWIIPELSWAL